MSIWARLFAVLALLTAMLGVGWKLHHAGYAQRAAEDKAAEAEHRLFNDRLQTRLQQEADKKEEVKNAKFREINQRLADALGDYSMLQRSSERVLPGDPAACSGATGAGLAKPDADFLTRYAANGNRLRAALDNCQQRYEAVRAAQPKE